APTARRTGTATIRPRNVTRRTTMPRTLPTARNGRVTRPMIAPRPLPSRSSEESRSASEWERMGPILSGWAEADEGHAAFGRVEPRPYPITHRDGPRIAVDQVGHHPGPGSVAAHAVGQVELDVGHHVGGGVAVGALAAPGDREAVHLA